MLRTLLRAPKETKVLTVVFLTVLVQVLVLSAFGLQALKGQEAEAERNTRALCRRVLTRNLADEMDRRLGDRQAEAAGKLTDLKVDTPARDAVLVDRIQEILRSEPLFRRAFLVDRGGSWYASDGLLLVPTDRPVDVRSGGDAVTAFDAIRAELAAGADPAEMLPRIAAELDQADVAARPRGLMLLAATAERAGKRDQAIAAWDRVLEENPIALDEGSRPPMALGPLAAAHRAELLLPAVRAGEKPAGELVRALLDLRRLLLENRFQLDDDWREWYRGRLDHLAADAGGALSPLDRAKLQTGLAELDDEEDALVSLRRRFGVRLSMVARGATPGGRLRDGTSLVFSVPLSGAAGASGAVVFEVDLAWVRNDLLAGLLRGLPLPEGVAVTVVDAEGRPVVAATGPPTGPKLAESRLGEALPFWIPVAYLRDASLNEQRTASARRLQLWIMGLSITGILCAGWFVMRTVRGELRVARMKSDFLSNVTHELKTPLTSIRMFVETLQEGRIRDEDERREYLDVIGRETERLSGLIQRVLDLARFEGKRRNALKRRKSDVGEVLRGAAEIFSRRLGDREAEISIEAPEDLPPLTIDPEAVQEMLLNLLSNAVKYGGRHVALAAERRDGVVRLSVRDDGIGIAEKDQSRVFEKFFRADDHLAREVEGSGLGLALVREIARAHGGRVGVSSRQGEGSTFTVSLPVEE